MSNKKTYTKDLNRIRISKLVMIPLVYIIVFAILHLTGLKKVTTSIINAWFIGTLLGVGILAFFPRKYLTEIQPIGSVLKLHVVGIFGNKKTIEIPVEIITKIKSRSGIRTPSMYPYWQNTEFGTIYFHTISGTRDFKTIGDARDSPELKKLNIELI
jgi:hypothetical protein